MMTRPAAGLVAFTEGDPIAVAARSRERGVGQGQRGDVEAQHRLCVAAARDGRGDGVQGMVSETAISTRPLAVRMVPDEQRVGRRRRGQRGADRDRVDVEQRVRLIPST